MKHALNRSAVLKGGGTAALALMLTKMTQAQARACCEPIDLSYFSNGLEFAADDSAARAYDSRRGRYGIRLRAQRPGESSPPALSSWTPLFLISDACAAGTDENGELHGTRKGGPQLLHYGIWVYTKKG